MNVWFISISPRKRARTLRSAVFAASSHPPQYRGRCYARRKEKEKQILTGVNGALEFSHTWPDTMELYSQFDLGFCCKQWKDDEWGRCMVVLPSLGSVVSKQPAVDPPFTVCLNFKEPFSPKARLYLRQPKSYD